MSVFNTDSSHVNMSKMLCVVQFYAHFLYQSITNSLKSTILSCFPARHTKRWLEKQLEIQGGKKKRLKELEDPACERRIKCKRKWRE